MAIVLPQIIGIKRVALDLLFPKWCIGCGREGDYICHACQRGLPLIMPPVCPTCGRPLSQGVACRDCCDTTMPIDGIRSPFLFDGIIRQAIHELKYRNLRGLVPLLAGFLHDYLVLNPLPVDVLVPVPLHRKRQRERGYNQSALLAGDLGRRCHLPVDIRGLVRQSYAVPQARSPSLSARRENVAGAFFCRDSRFHGQRVLLIDDVATSGATLNACAEALKAVGAVTVWGLVMALER